jgi:hypothetical protein
VLYVEGARDREILGCWGRRIDPSFARCIERSTVILGGRQPARAVADFRKRGGAAAGLSGLIVLDRDHHSPLDEDPPPRVDGNAGEDFRVDTPRVLADTDAGLEVFVWGMRHIESYLLVPAAIRRMLGLAADDTLVERSIAETTHPHVDLPGRESDAVGREQSPDPFARAQQTVHAKRILGAGGSLSEALGVELNAGDIARAMRVEDLHRDVHSLFERIGSLSGIVPHGPQVVIRPSRREP